MSGTAPGEAAADAATDTGAGAAPREADRAGNEHAFERIETKIAFLERAHADLSDTVFKQQLEIQALTHALNVLVERVQAAQAEESPREVHERPPHY